MTVLAKDNFKRRDGYVGSNYADILVAGSQAVIRHQGFTNKGTWKNYGMALWRPCAFPPDQYAQVEFKEVGAKGTDCMSKVIVRGSAGHGGTCYFVLAGRNTFTGKTWCWELWKQVWGQGSLLGGGAGFNTDVKVGDVMRIEANRNRIRMLRNGILLCEVEDEDIREGSVGIGINTGEIESSKPDDGTIATNFEAGTLDPLGTRISFVTPTRNRIAQFRRMLDSLRATARTAVEVVIYVDDDDPAREQYQRIEGVKCLVGPRIDAITQCWNECLKLATGDIFMQGNDDVVFRTPGWDEVVIEAFTRQADKILMVHGSDLGYHHDHGNTFGTHAFVHRRWIDTVGYFIPPWFCSDFGDTWINDCANAIKRRVFVPIAVEHMHFLMKNVAQDETTLERLARHKRDKPDQLYSKYAPKRAEDSEKLRAVMKPAKWSILILTQPARAEFLKRLLAVLQPQIQAAEGVELIIDMFDPKLSLGANREQMRKKAEGEYICFVDDDDMVAANYVTRILPLLDGVDYVGFRVQQTIDGADIGISNHSLRYPGWSEKAGLFYRDLMFWNPTLRKLALEAELEGGRGEDVRWANKIRKLGEVRSEHYVDEVLYFYRKHTWHEPDPTPTSTPRPGPTLISWTGKPPVGIEKMSTPGTASNPNQAPAKVPAAIPVPTPVRTQVRGPVEPTNLELIIAPRIPTVIGPVSNEVFGRTKAAVVAPIRPLGKPCPKCASYCTIPSSSGTHCNQCGAQF